MKHLLKGALSPPFKFSLIGVLLGLGAPVGSLILRLFAQPSGGLWTRLMAEWQSATYYYLYMSFGTTIAFGLFGYVLGGLNKDLQDLSITDGLTTIYNHRYIQEHLTQEVQRSDRFHTPLTCMMIDIDDFKRVNDRFGHVFGDKVLVTIARLIRQAVRTTDVLGRYGGEEFFVVMPQTETDDALPVAERLRTSIAEHSFKTDGCEVRVSVSVGLATYPRKDHGVKSKNGVLSAADQALYEAKRMGKNRTIAWHP